MLQLDKLKNLVQESQGAIGTVCSKWNMVLDSANYQTKSKEEFENARTEFEKKGLNFLLELSHAARRIRIYQVPENLQQEFSGLKYIEVTEPKPGKKIEISGWEYISYVVDNYDGFLSEGCKSPDDLNKVREIGPSKFCYYYPTDNRIQFRNKSVSEAENSEEVTDIKKKI